MCLAVPGRLVSTHESNGTPMGRVDFGGVVKEVCLAYVPDLRVGDYTIVHVGFALQKLDEQAALETLDAIRRLQRAEDDLPEPPEAPGGFKDAEA